MSFKVAVFTNMGFGHVNPFLALVEGMVEDEIDTRVYALKEFVPSFEKLTSNVCTLPPYGKWSSLEERNFLRSDDYLDYVFDDFEKFSPELIIHDLYDINGYLCGEKFQIPTVSVSLRLGFGTFSDDNVVDLTDPKNQIFLDQNQRYVETIGINVLEKNGLTAIFPSELLNFFTQLEELKTEIDPKKSPKLYEILEKNKDIKSIYTGPIVNRTSSVDLVGSEQNDEVIKIAQQNPKQTKIIFSLGSVLTNPKMPLAPGGAPNTVEFMLHNLKNLIEALGNRPDTLVFVAVGGHIIETKPFEFPQNFIVRNYMPQYQLLKNYADVFITHTGLNSVSEAIDCAVPMIVIPGFGDQQTNSQAAIDNKIGLANWDIYDYYNTGTADGLRQAIETVLTDPKYKQNIEKLSKKSHEIDPVKTIITECKKLIQ